MDVGYRNVKLTTVVDVWLAATSIQSIITVSTDKGVSDYMIAKQLIELRTKKGISQEQLANELGVSRQAISKWETGIGHPDTDNLIKLVSYYDSSADYILFGKKDDAAKESIFSDMNFVKALVFFGMLVGIISITVLIVLFVIL